MKDLSCQEIQNILEASESKISFMINCSKARAENPEEYWELFQEIHAVFWKPKKEMNK